MVDCQRGKASTPSLNRVLLRLKDISRVTFLPWLWALAFDRFRVDVPEGESVFRKVFPAFGRPVGVCFPLGRLVTRNDLNSSVWKDWWPQEHLIDGNFQREKYEKWWENRRNHWISIGFWYILMILGDCRYPIFRHSHMGVVLKPMQGF